MKCVLVSLALLSASTLIACDKDGSAGGTTSPQPSAEGRSAASVAKPSTAAALAAPRIGGSVVLAGDFSVEVVVHEAGRVEALVSDATSKLRTDVKLSLDVAARGGARESVELTFAAPRGRFEGQAKAGIELVGGPVSVTLDVNGKALAAKLEFVAALPEPKLGGHMLAAGRFTSELFVRPSGEVQAFVRNAAGAELKAGATVSARIQTSAGAMEDVALAFDVPRASFIGRARAGTRLAPGPLKLSVEADGTIGVGGLAELSLAVDAAHGGQLVAVGAYSVELVTKGSEIQAFVYDAAGKAHVAGDLNLKLELGALPHRLALAWHAPSLSYKVSAGAGLDLAAPVRVSLAAGGKAHVGAIASLTARASLRGAAGARADLGAKSDLNAAADAKLRAPAVNAKVGAAADAAKASAKLQVTPPKVNVTATKSTGAKAGGGAKASGGISFGTK